MSSDRNESSVPDVRDDYDGPADRIRLLAQPVGFLVVVALMLYSRAHMRGYAVPDFTEYFAKWYTILDTQGFAAFGHRFADYNVPYLYLLWVCTLLPMSALTAVKLIANGADVLIAIAVYQIVERYTSRTTGLVAALVVMLLPALWMDSALVGQTDPLCTGFGMLAIAALVRGRQRAAWLWWGVSLAFKVQAVFFLPFLLLAFAMNRRRRWTALPLAVVPFVVAGLPAMFAGLSPKTYLTTYVDQVGFEARLTLSDNFWAFIVIGAPSPLRPMATAFALAVVGLFAVVVLRKGRWGEDMTQFVVTAAAVTMLTLMLLPGIRHRYFQPADVLVLCYAFLRPHRWWVALVTAVSTFVQYAHFSLRAQWPLPGDSFFAIPAVFVTAVLCRDALAVHRPRSDDGVAAVAQPPLAPRPATPTEAAPRGATSQGTPPGRAPNPPQGGSRRPRRPRKVSP